MQNKQISFGPFRFDESNECLWRGSQAIPLRPKPFAVLKYLINHPNVLVTKQQLLQDVWHYDSIIDTRTVDTHMRRLREKLGKAAKYLDTVRGVGYRFLEG